MKNRIFSALIIMFLPGILFTNCRGSENKLEDAKETVPEAKRVLSDAKQGEETEAIKTANEAGWKTFSDAAGVKIENFESRIDELKQKVKLSGVQMYKTTNKQLDTLEMRNKELKLRLGNYKKNKSDWDYFKTNYYNDTRNLDDDLKSFTVKKNSIKTTL